MQSGELIGHRFEIEAPAGAGGMSTVWRARDCHSGARVALKIVPPWGDPIADERFAREARLLAELCHPLIVRYVAHGETASGQRYLAMEWLEGTLLRERLARGPLELAEAVAIGAHLSEALAFVHQHGVVHRDVKPANLMLLGEDAPGIKLIDFGIARVSYATRSRTRAGSLLGTPGYAAPEQVRGDASVDARADLFALGAVLYECLSGQPSFCGDSGLALLAKILLHDPPRLSSMCTGVPEQLDELVMRLLAKEPAERPQSAQEVAQALAQLTTRPPTSVRALPARRPSITSSEQRLLLVILAGPLPRLEAAGSPAAPASLQPDALGTLRATVAAYGGNVDALADGAVVVTLTGAAVATDQALRAARCALALGALLPGRSLAMAAGRATFLCGSSLGELIDRAASLLAAVPGASGGDRGVIVLDPVTAALLEQHFEVTPCPQGLLLRAEREPLECARTLLGKRTPYVGRESEGAVIEAMYKGCVDGPMARAVLVTGTAGIGKSRLAREFVAMLRSCSSPAEVWVARGDAMKAGSPYLMLGGALRRAAGVLGAEPLEVRQHKLESRVRRSAASSAAAGLVEFLGELAGVKARGEPSVQLLAAQRDRVLMGDQVRAAWLDFVAAESRRHPIVFVLEDLHWGDLPSVTLLDETLRLLADQPLFVLALGRPEVLSLFPHLWAERGVCHIHLNELPPQASERLVREVLGPGVEAEIVTRLVGVAGGNAFYLEELIRAVAAQSPQALPVTVLAMAQARLEQLDVEARRILRAGSVFGRVFWPGGVRALLSGGPPAGDPEPWLEVLVEQEILNRAGPRRLSGEPTFAFRHELLREAAYASLTDDDRVTGHRLAGSWLEAAGERDPVVLAEHCERGGVPERAIGFYLQAAQSALKGNDLDAAIARVERGLRCGASGPAMGVLRSIEAEARFWRGDHAQAESCAFEAMQVLPARSAAWYAAAADGAEAAGKLGHVDRLVDLGSALRVAGAAPAASAPAVMALVRTTVQLLFAGQREIAEALMQQIEAAGSAEAGPAIAAWIDHARSLQSLFAGDLGAYAHHKRAAVSLFEEAGDRRNACSQRGKLGYALRELGAHAEAERVLGAALATARQMGLLQVIAVVEHNLGLTLMYLGRVSEARRVEEAAVNTFVAQGDRRLEAAARMYLAMILQRAGDLDAAAKQAQEGFALAPAASPAQVHSGAVLARIRLWQGRAGEALEVARAAMDLLTTLGGIDEGEALLRLTYAEALAACGDRAPAQAAIRAAGARLRARAERISDPELRRSFLAAVPENARTIELERAWEMSTLAT